MSCDIDIERHVCTCLSAWERVLIKPGFISHEKYDLNHGLNHTKTRFDQTRFKPQFYPLKSRSRPDMKNWPNVVSASHRPREYSGGDIATSKFRDCHIIRQTPVCVLPLSYSSRIKGIILSLLHCNMDWIRLHYLPATALLLVVQGMQPRNIFNL